MYRFRCYLQKVPKRTQIQTTNDAPYVVYVVKQSNLQDYQGNLRRYHRHLHLLDLVWYPQANIFWMAFFCW